MSVTMYGIKNCDTIRKARMWMDENGVAFAFHDYKAEGIDAERLSGWIDTVGWEMLLNRAGTTFRKLDEADKQDLDAGMAAALMLAHPSMIKRPVVEHAGGLLVGFAPDRYAAALL